MRCEPALSKPCKPSFPVCAAQWAIPCWVCPAGYDSVAGTVAGPQLPRGCLQPLQNSVSRRRRCDERDETHSAQERPNGRLVAFHFSLSEVCVLMDPPTYKRIQHQGYVRPGLQGQVNRAFV